MKYDRSAIVGMLHCLLEQFAANSWMSTVFDHIVHTNYGKFLEAADGYTAEYFITCNAKYEKLKKNLEIL